MSRGRKIRSKRSDKQYFNYTARKTKAINLPQIVSRGGIRL